MVWDAYGFLEGAAFNPLPGPPPNCFFVSLIGSLSSDVILFPIEE